MTRECQLCGETYRGWPALREHLRGDHYTVLYSIGRGDVDE